MVSIDKIVTSPFLNPLYFQPKTASCSKAFYQIITVRNGTYSLFCNFQFVTFQLHLMPSHTFAMKKGEQNSLSDLFQIIQYVYIFSYNLIYLFPFYNKQSCDFTSSLV